jgi:glycosyltransferase involved in cell wall biosynthesis
MTAESQSEPTFSVIVPVFNNPAGMTRTLAALRECWDEADGVELVVVDDGSTDETPELAARLLAPLPAALLVTTSNRGPSAARNTGATTATGDYFIFVDANDEPIPGWLAEFRALVAPNVGMAHVRPVIVERDEVPKFGSLLPGCFAIQRGLFSDLGGYDEQLRFAENSDLVARAHGLCQRSGREVAKSDLIALRIHDLTNPRDYDQRRLDAMLHILDRDREELASEPAIRARHARVGAVAAIRVGDVTLARRLALVSARAEPLRGRNWARLALTWLPDLARHRWVSQKKTAGHSATPGGSTNCNVEPADDSR